MAAIQIIVDDMSPSDGSVFVTGRAFVQLTPGLKTAAGETIQAGGGGPIGWVATIAWADSAAAIGTAIKDAAVAAVTAAGYAVGVLDKKTLYGVPMDG